MSDLQTIAQEIRVCTLCPLANSRSLAVPGEGPPSARLMFIGEAPGKKEDLQGKPFVGHAGNVLNRALLNAGIKRSEVFLTSVVKCRPPNNRVPGQSEIHSCITAHLQRQIRLIDPEIICLLGATATRALLGLSPLKAVRGQWIVKERRYFATYHPAGAGRSHSWNNLFQVDIRKLGAFLANNKQEIAPMSTGSGPT